jgi:hypothetical protein
MDMTKIFNVEDMLYAVIWKLVCNAINDDIPISERKAYILNIVEAIIDKWV